MRRALAEFPHGEKSAGLPCSCVMVSASLLVSTCDQVSSLGT